MSGPLDALTHAPADAILRADWHGLLDAVRAGDVDVRAFMDAKDAELRELLARELVQGTSTVHAEPGPRRETVSVAPGDDLSAAIERLRGPTGAGHGELSLAAGEYVLSRPLLLSGFDRLVVSGAGPATVIRAPAHAAAIVCEGCRDIVISRVRVEAGPGDPSAHALDDGQWANGTLSILGCSIVTVSDCAFSCPPDTLGPQCGLALGRVGEIDDGPVRVDRCRFEVGAGQRGVQVRGPRRATIERCWIGPRSGATEAPLACGIEALPDYAGGSLRVRDNLIEGALRGIAVVASASGTPGAPPSPQSPAQGMRAVVAVVGNVIEALVPDERRAEACAIEVGDAASITIARNVATLRRPGSATGVPATGVDGVRVRGRVGAYLNVRDTSLSGFDVGVRVEPAASRDVAMWAVTDTMAAGGTDGAIAPESVAQERNEPGRIDRRIGVPARLELAPAVGTSPRGAPARIMARVTDAVDTPVGGVIVRFSASGANAVQPARATTNARGEAGFEYAGSQLGVDTIVAFADVNGNGRQDVGDPFASATHSYLRPLPASIAFSSAVLTATAGTPVALSVRVADAGGNPLPDVDVAVVATGANPGELGTVRTDAQGTARVTHTGAQPGTDTLTARAIGDGGRPLEALATIVLGTAVVASVVLRPTLAHATRGASLAFTATIADVTGRPVAGAAVRFTVAGVNPRDESAVSDAAGQAHFSYVGTSAGPDTVAAFADLDGDGVRDPADPFGEALSLFVEPEPDRVVVPWVVGEPAESVGEILGSVGLGFHPHAEGKSGPLQPWWESSVATHQSPAAGTSVAVGSNIDVWFSEGRWW